MSVKNITKYVIGLALAVLLLWWVLRGTDRQMLIDQLARTSVLLLGTSILCNLGHNIFRALRWRALLEPVHPDTPFRPMFAAIILGYMTSWIVPGRVGELVRIREFDRLWRRPTSGA